MSKRKNISKTVRFEVFKRDSFTCQYCGKNAPDAVLEIDHIIPVSKGGDNDISNLITSCFDCNRGKSNKKLTENKTIKLQKQELDKLNKRREQLEMMSKWRIELLDIENKEAEKIIEIINTNNGTEITLTSTGRKNMINLIKKHGFREVLECALISFDQYEEHEIAFKKIGAIINNRKMQNEHPELKDLYYIRGIARNKFNYINERKAMELLKICYEIGASIENLKKFTLECNNWSQWRDGLEEFIICEDIEESEGEE